MNDIIMYDMTKYLCAKKCIEHLQCVNKSFNMLIWDAIRYKREYIYIISISHNCIYCKKFTRNIHYQWIVYKIRNTKLFRNIIKTSIYKYDDHNWIMNNIDIMLRD